ncbi:MAG TPA: hypothetical protein VK112_12540 [Fodinibius sp.]|nr:hypothetical protein [Fodinibius sp.]
MNDRISLQILMLSIALISCSGAEQEKTQSATVDSPQTALRTIKTERDSLREILAADSVVSDPWFYPDSDGRSFIEQGIEKPEQYIADALRERPGLIPLDPVLGGTMHFIHIKVLGSQWVVAAYEDGHITGKTLYQYDLQDDGELTFTEVASVRPS